MIAQEVPLILDLTDEEAQALRQLLHDYLTEFRLEVARTDARAFRHDLVKRQDLCERLVGLLDGS